MSITSDTARLILQHRFSFVDDPQKVGRNNQPKWKKDPLGGYRLNREYETDPKQYRQELLLLLTLYVEDVLGAKGREIWEKQGSLLPNEKKRLHDIGKLGFDLAKKEELDKAKVSKKLTPISLSAGCSATVFTLSALEFAILARLDTAALPAFSVYMTDWDNEHNFTYADGTTKLKKYSDFDRQMKKSPIEFKKVINELSKDAQHVGASGLYPGTDPFLAVRSLAFHNEVEIGKFDSFATIVAKLFYKLHRPKEHFPSTKVCDGDNIGVWQSMFNVGERASEQKDADFRESIGVEDGWVGYFLHMFLLSCGYVSLQINLVPMNVIEFGLAAFGVRDSPNPKQTLQVLLEKLVDRATLIFLIWAQTGEEPPSKVWDLNLVDLWRQLIAGHGQEHFENSLLKKQKEFD
jgi:hypothetical protein